MYHKIILPLLLIGILLMGCRTETTPQSASPTPPPASATPGELTGPSPTPFTPTELPADLPLAARVNGAGLSMDEYQAELARYRAAEAGISSYTDQEILDELINQVLLAQAAVEAGFLVDVITYQARLDQLGLSQAELADWIAVNGYTEQSFQRAFERAIRAAWMRDQIAASVPSTSEQIHARQILLYNSDAANSAFAQLQAGTDFVTLAAQSDPITLGDLGWFPKGYLLVPELDAIIFDLEPGEFSPVIETELGFHIVQVIEKEDQRPLTTDARQALQIQAIQDWLSSRREQSTIELFAP